MGDARICDMFNSTFLLYLPCTKSNRIGISSGPCAKVKLASASVVLQAQGSVVADATAFARIQLAPLGPRASRTGALSGLELI